MAGTNKLQILPPLCYNNKNTSGGFYLQKKGGFL